MTDSTGCIVYQIPTRTAEHLPDGWSVPCWIQRDGHFVADCTIIVADLGDVPAILADPATIGRITAHAREHADTPLRLDTGGRP